MHTELWSETNDGTENVFMKPRFQLIVLLLLFATAFGIRLYHITRAPFDFAPIRQYQQAHIARAYYYEGLDDVPEWKRDIANLNVERMAFVLEPRIMEYMTVLAYHVLGGEHLWVPRLLSVIFWMVGGLFFYLIARKIIPPGAALFSTAFYLFLPYGILASRSFQPDPMMLMMLICSVYAILVYFEHPSKVRLLIAAVVSSVAFLTKPFCLFPIFGVYISVAVYKYGLWKALFNARFVLFLFVSMIPTSIYYIYGVFAHAGFLRNFTQISFLPHLFLYGYFWKDWLTLIGQVVGYLPFLCAIAGLFLIKEGLSRAVLCGLWIGYFVLGFFATYHIHTHSYYHLQFIPIVALSLGPVVTLATDRLSSFFSSGKRLAVVCLIFLVILFSAGDSIRHMDRSAVKGTLKTVGAFIGINPQFYRFITSDYVTEVNVLKEIGEIVGHSKETLLLTSDYGRSLAYEGELSGFPWPNTMSLQGRKEQGILVPSKEETYNTDYLMVRTHGEYIKYAPDFFIILDFEEFEKQGDLKDFLNAGFPILAKTNDYLIYDLRKMAGSNL